MAESYELGVGRRPVVVGLDGSEAAQRALAWAAELAQRLGVEIVGVHAFEPLRALGEIEPPVDFAELRRAHQERLEQVWLAPATEAGVTCRGVVVDDDPVHALCWVATEERASHIVISTRGHGGLHGVVFGSVAHKLPRMAPCPVTIVPHD